MASSACSTRADGDFVPIDDNGFRPKGQHKPRPTINSLKADEKFRPARDEIISSAWINVRNSSVRLWG